MTVRLVNPAYPGPPPMGSGPAALQARVKYLGDRRQSTQVLQREVAVFSASGTLLVSGAYTSADFGLPQAVNRVALQATFANLSNTMRFWIEDAGTNAALANLSPGVTVRVSLPVGRNIRFRATGRTTDALSSFTIFAKYERV